MTKNELAGRIKIKIGLRGPQWRVEGALTGGVRGLANVSRDIFSKILKYNNVFWPDFLKEKGYFFGKSNCHVTPGGGPQWSFLLFSAQQLLEEQNIITTKNNSLILYLNCQ